MTFCTTDTGPILPVEIMDAVIDQLRFDLKMLGVCGMVCSEWLIRSRHHIFSTVQLWPWRVRHFLELSRSPQCTFTRYVNCIEVDDAKAKSGSQTGEEDDFLFHKFISSALISRFSHIESLRIRNVDWTLLPPSEQDRLRERLATFTKLRYLAFDDVMFHDLREVARITALFSSLYCLTANVQFSKYMEYTIASAATLALPTSLEVLRLCTDDAIPVLLSSSFKESRLSSLILDNVKFWHLQYVGSALRSLSGSLRHLEIHFSRDGVQWVNSTDLAHMDLKHQTRLQSFRLGGIVLAPQAPCMIETHIPSLLASIPRTGNMKEFSLGLVAQSTSLLQPFGWSALEQALVAMPRCLLNVTIVSSDTLAGTGDEDTRRVGETMEGILRSELKKLRKSERLNIWTRNDTIRP